MPLLHFQEKYLNKQGHACLQYKYNRHSDSLLPRARKFDIGSAYTSSVNGIGTLVECSPEKMLSQRRNFGITLFDITPTTVQLLKLLSNLGLQGVQF